MKALQALVLLKVFAVGLAVRMETVNRTVTPIAKLNHTSEHAKAKCNDSNWSGKFDLVLTWWTDTHQSDPWPRKPANHSKKAEVFLQTRMNTRIENQREIMYLLRGAEKNGVMKHVRNVYIVVNPEVLRTFGPPRDLDFNHPQLKLISDETIGITGKDSYASKFASLHLIPGISDWIVVLQDDVFPVKEFNEDALYDRAAKMPLVHLGADTYQKGYCGPHGGASPAEHGPWLVSKCRLAELESMYPEHFNRVRTNGPGQDNDESGGGLDVQCLYDNWAKNAGWAKQSDDATLITVCHTNGGCREDTFMHPTTMFMNFQGNGVSDDYDSVPDSYDAPSLAQSAHKWFHTNFPTPSRFEKKP